MTGGVSQNFLIILGDFGIVWSQKETKEENWKLKWLNEKPFTTLFIDGNHENYDRLYSEYPVKEWHGGLVHEIRPNVLHLIRGGVFDILGMKFFAFGGASSHDIQDGILEMHEVNKIKQWQREYRMFRVNHLSWWVQEIASDEEMQTGIDNLKAHNNEVDYILTHTLPTNALNTLRALTGFQFVRDRMSDYLDGICNTTKFKTLYCGHYHDDRTIGNKYTILYDLILPLHNTAEDSE